MLATGGIGSLFDVDRGPDWVFVRFTPADVDWTESPPVAESIWNVLAQNFIYRVVVEFDRVTLLRSYLLGQLVLLARRVHAQGGVLRICGLTPHNQEMMRISRLDELLPNYRNRGEAVMGSRPTQPR